jgi:carboxylesterase type B
MVAVWSGFLVLCAALSVGVLAAPTVVDGSVKYVGIVNNGVTESFLGIKFGQDTGGTNRFKRPRPYAYPAGATVQATTPGPACAQKLGNPVPSVSDLLSNVTEISEDCLYIRVDRPVNTTARAKLPVMVYLYGGGYNIGQIYDVAYDPYGLVRNSAAKGMPVVYAAIKCVIFAEECCADDPIR